ncbi:hypothetical protein GQ457_11G024310 [Hibiscus cannabinus]
MHGELGATEEDPASLISVADRNTVTVTEFSNTTSITDRWRNKEDRALGSSDRGVRDKLLALGCNLTITLRYLYSFFSPRIRFLGISSLLISQTRKSSPPTLLHRRSSDRASIAVRVIHDSRHGVPLFFPSQHTPPSTRSMPPFASKGCETVLVLSLHPYLHLGRRGSC